LFVDNEKSQNIFLQDQDEIVIPVQLPTVNVTGNVNRPGLVSWIPGKTTDYYVEKTGGYSWNARISKMRLIRAQTGTWIKPKKNTPVEIGDTIFVPEKQELNYWQLWKDLMLVVSQIATVVIVVQTVR
jgi:protein involved in polysaccharide export with SLBB domain